VNCRSSCIISRCSPIYPDDVALSIQMMWLLSIQVWPYLSRCGHIYPDVAPSIQMWISIQMCQMPPHRLVTPGLVHKDNIPALKHPGQSILSSCHTLDSMMAQQQYRIMRIYLDTKGLPDPSIMTETFIKTIYNFSSVYSIME